MDLFRGIVEVQNICSATYCAQKMYTNVNVMMIAGCR